MFQSATLKLTGLYLMIIVAISVFFSVNLYHISVRGLENGLQQQEVFIRIQPGFQGNLDLPSLLAEQRETRLTEGKRQIVAELIRSDLLIIILGGIGSYFLARRTLQPVQAAHDAQVRFTADASHELRTPIAAMQTEIEVALRDQKLTQKEATNLLRSNLEELAKLTNLSQGLLQLARDNEKPPLELVRLNGVFKQALERVKKLATAKKIIVYDNLKKEIKFTGNETSLTQLLVILLDNAIKYSPGGSRVTLNARSATKELIITVKDHGIGIKAADLPHIFDRFYRADSSRSKERVEGYGLGLSIAKQIVQSHRGTIAAKSNVGQGSTLTVKLPLTKS